MVGLLKPVARAKDGFVVVEEGFVEILGFYWFFDMDNATAPELGSNHSKLG